MQESKQGGEPCWEILGALLVVFMRKEERRDEDREKWKMRGLLVIVKTTETVCGSYVLQSAAYSGVEASVVDCRRGTVAGGLEALAEP